MKIKEEEEAFGKRFYAIDEEMLDRNETASKQESEKI